MLEKNKRLTLIETTFLLKKTALFQDLDLDLLLAISDKLHYLYYNSSDLIFEKGQVIDHLYFIAQGRVLIKVIDHECILQEGDYFGEETLFNAKPRAYTAIAHQQTLLFSLSKIHLMSIISECPSVAINLLEAVTEHLSFRKR